MSRKHYIKIARLLREAELTDETRKTLVDSFVTLFADENPSFSPSKFRDAATPNPYDGETEHQCDERPFTEGGTMTYRGEIAAPGYGTAYECVVCGAPRVRLGRTWLDPRESDPIELRPEDVI